MKYQRLTAGLLACEMVFGIGTILPKQAGFQQATLTASAEEAEYTEGTYSTDGTYGLKYRNYGTHIEITDCDKNAKTVEVPAEIDGLPVTTIGIGAFNGCTSLESVTIPRQRDNNWNVCFL